MISSNALENLAEILQKAETLKKINANSAGNIGKFPKINSEALEFLNI